MALPIKYSAEIETHINDGHFRVYPKVWPNNKRIWLWTKGSFGPVGGAFTTQKEAEDAAVAWYNEQAASFNR